MVVVLEVFAVLLSVDGASVSLDLAEDFVLGDDFAVEIDAFVELVDVVEVFTSEPNILLEESEVLGIDVAGVIGGAGLYLFRGPL